jgi:signal transduction histidine kinase
VSHRAAEKLHRENEHVMRTWEARVRARIPPARAHGKLALRDSLPKFIHNLAVALNPDTEQKLASEDNDVCQVHGAERALTPGYALDDMILEYAILCSTVFELLEAGKDQGPLAKEDRDTIVDSVIGAISEASLQYVATQQMLRDQFIATLSHDLRGPLTAIKVAAGLVQRQAEKPELARTYAGRIIENVNRTDKMIRDLLDTHRVRAGERLPLTLEPCDLYTIVQDVCQELASIYGERFVVRSESDIRGVWSGEGLRRVVENLLTNAVKYGNKESDIIVTLKNFPGERASLEVLNFGNPIPASEIETLFDPFSRTSSAKSSSKQGWGLGLTLVKGMAEAHGGSVSVSSDEAGTTFRVELPKDSTRFQ